MIDKGIVISHLVLWIDSNIEHRLSVEDVAKKSGYSKWHLQRMFSDETGKSLGKFIRERKLAYVLEELLVTDESILNLALKYGFESQQSFTRTFTRKYGAPPHQYRMKAKKKSALMGNFFKQKSIY